MADDLKQRLRAMNLRSMYNVKYGREAADRIEALEAEVATLRNDRRTMHRRAQTAEGKLARLSGWLEHLRILFKAEPRHYWLHRYTSAALRFASPQSGLAWALGWDIRRAELDTLKAEVATLKAEKAAEVAHADRLYQAAKNYNDWFCGPEAVADEVEAALADHKARRSK